MKGSGHALTEGTALASPKRKWGKLKKTSVQIVGVQPEILIEHFLHTSQKHSC